VTPLVAFNLGEAPDHRGRFVGEILQQDDDWLEATHDYIQWLFPLREPSQAVPGSPVVDAATRDAFLGEDCLREQLRANLQRMLAFYGLAWQDGRVVEAATWGARRRNWFTHPTHNNLRLTRIIRSLSLLGLDAEARALQHGLDALQAAEPDCGVGATAVTYWREALRT